MRSPMRCNSVDRETELVLVRRVRVGEEAAFDAIHSAFNARLFNFLARLTRRREVAEELLEETWLRFVRHARQLDPDTRLGAWLFTVGRNLHVSYCRTRAVESEVIGGLSLWPGTVADTPFEVTARNEFERRVEAELAALPETMREALLLVGVDGMQPSEAAIVCGITPEAMRQRVRRARTVLAERLGYSLPDLRVRTGT
jgi:RNA polymerase sigma-70 factor (ECF subfamily)